MIKINLLPPELQGKKARRAKAPTAGAAAPSPAGAALIIALEVVIVAAICLWAGYGAFSTVAKSKREVAAKQKELETKKAEVNRRKADYEVMLRKLDRMRDQKEILAALMPADRLLWSEKINMLANFIPDGVFITDLQVTEDRQMVETEQSIKRRQEWDKRKAAAKEGENIGEQPVVVKKPIITQTLILRAAATGQDGNERFNRMLSFERAMQGYQTTGRRGETRRFMDNFVPDIEFGTMESKMLDGVMVWVFEFRLKSRPYGATQQ